MKKSLKSLSDEELVNRLRTLVEKEKYTTLIILSHLVEVHRRGLYLAKGYATLQDSRRLRSEVKAGDGRLEFEQKWKVEGVVSERVKRKLQRCKALLSNKYPKGVDYDILFDELTERFLDQEDPERRLERKKKRQEKQKEKRTTRGCFQIQAEKTPSRAAIDSRSRYIPQAVRETVWTRDGGRCAFVGTNGRRCGSTHNLQFDHFPVPFGRSGPSTVENLRLLCARHNRYTAKKVYGASQIERHYQRRE